MTKEKRIRFTLRLTNNLIEDLRKEANKQGVSINALILNILWEWLEKNIENWIGGGNVMNISNTDKNKFQNGFLNLVYKNGIPCIEIISKEKNNLTNKDSKGYF